MNTIKVIRGTSNQFSLSVVDVNNNPYQIQSGEKIIFGVKVRPTDNDYILTKVILESPYIITLTPDDTINLSFFKYVYDIGLESGEDFYNIIPTSPFIVCENITKHGDKND